MSDKLSRSMDTNELHNETAVKEVQHLLKNGVSDLNPEIINRLRSKYSDDNVVDSIMEYFSDRRQKIKKIASIFMTAFESKYKNDFYSMSLSKFMKRCLKYKKRYNIADEEFDEIRRMFEMKIYNSSSSISTRNVIYPNTNVSRVLGYPVVESTDSIKPSTPDDFAYLQEILNTYAVIKNMHSFVIIQTMLYQDLADEAIHGKFETKHDINRFVHPVLAALFLPKIKSIEERMLYASIAGIIKSRYNKERIVTKPDYELYYAMVVDPADIVCDSTSPIKDLKNRAEVQVQLWNNVYNLRNGKCYEASSMDFIAYIDKCKISNVDNPDIMFLSDEGVILRRLFSVFSYRPIIVTTHPVFGLGRYTTNPYNLPLNPSVITSIPYITVKLPHFSMPEEEQQTITLEKATNYVHFYMDHGKFVPKVTQIIGCSGPLIFYVPRKTVTLPLHFGNPLLSSLGGIDSLLSSAHHYNTINQTRIEFENTLTISKNNDDTHKFQLRSVVAFDTHQENNNNIIIGHIAYIYKYNNNTTVHDKIYAYNPRHANTRDNDKQPIKIYTGGEEKTILGENGTIFVYTAIENQ